MIRKIGAAVKLMRPAQWIKNVFVFGALVFGPRRDDPQAILVACAAFGIFCLLAASVYALNDLLDRREDALHPTKRFRPIASGALSPVEAGLFAIVLAAGGVAAALQLPRGFALTACTYVALNLFYSLWAKHFVLLDVILIAIGFVLRALAGAQAIDVEVSAWLVVCTFTLCLFLGFGKRRCELAVMSTGDAHAHRKSLVGYTPELLAHLLSVTGGIAVVTFLLYTLDPNTPSPKSLVFTTPLVFYAIFRYASVIEQGHRTGPTDVLINDRPFLVTAILWTVMTLGLIALGPAAEQYLPRLRYPGMPPATQPVHGDRPSG
ncbi:Decaprenyl-phosphate phosphoribosyltransferase [Phycisphaerae bacterium RAS2]|nr:Decaprenyl-phosphate phosphoribosyltransferase [Phycisphaerae bacterium RAS2]